LRARVPAFASAELYAFFSSGSALASDPSSFSKDFLRQRLAVTNHSSGTRHGLGLPQHYLASLAAVRQLQSTAMVTSQVERVAFFEFQIRRVARGGDDGVNLVISSSFFKTFFTTFPSEGNVKN
jgi:hypothetical protein